MNVIKIDAKTRKLIEQTANAKARQMTGDIIKICVTAFGLAMGDAFGFKRKRFGRVAERAQEYMTEQIAQYLSDDVLPEKLERDYKSLF